MISVGIVGTGGMGRVHANHYRAIPGVKLYAFDADSERLAEFCKAQGAEPTSSYSELVSKADGVDVCLPTDLHLPFGLEAISAGRHVLLEKPMASSVKACVELVEAATKAGVILLPGQVVRYFPEYRLAHDIVVKGKIGKPAAARMRRGGKAPLGSAGWFRDSARSGGVLFDLSIHEFDWLRWTLGEVHTVEARSVGFSSSRQVEGDYGLATLGFDSGAVAHVEGTWLDPAGFRTTFEVCGSEGMLEYDSRRNQAAVTSSTSGVRMDSAISGADDPYRLQLTTFVDAIRDGVHPPVTPRDGLMAVAIAEAAVESAKNSKKVTVAREF